MKDINLSKEKKVQILKELVNKSLPNKTFIYDHQHFHTNFIIITSDKRFGIKSKYEAFRITYKTKGLFGGTKTRDLNLSVIEKILNGGTPIGEIISSPMVDETNFQNDDFQLLNKFPTPSPLSSD